MSSPNQQPHHSSSQKEYNVYAEEIDPTNQMPLNPNQLPHPAQTKPLSTAREPSSIPKGGTETSTWTYPSPQQFYNALKRKGKAEDDPNVTEEMVTEIVGIHNNMNEKTWARVMEWEALRQHECNEYPRLSRFMGRPDDLSPRAWLSSTLLRKEKPFDRHDWIISRCGKEVRYVIDYYHHEDKSHLDRSPKDKSDFTAMKSIDFVCRPALDSIAAVWDRVRMPLLSATGYAPTFAPIKLSSDPVIATTKSTQVPSSTADPPPECPMSSKHVSKLNPTPPPPVTNLNLSTLTAKDVEVVSGDIQTRCKTAFEGLQTCANPSMSTTERDLQCERASIALFYCIACRVCPIEANRFALDLSSNKELDEMMTCVGAFRKRASELREAKPSGGGA